MPENILVSKQEIQRAIVLWNSLSLPDIKRSDPFRGRTGRSSAAAYNFLLLATAGRVWNQQVLDSALPQMTNFETGQKDLEGNPGHMKRIIDHGTRYVKLCGRRAVIWADAQHRNFHVNPELLRDSAFQDQYKSRYNYIAAAISSLDLGTDDRDATAPNVATTSQKSSDETKTQKDPQPNRPDDVMYDLRRILTDKNINGTTKLALVEARIGQGKFREGVLAQWNNECAVTGAKTVAVIRASHIKPWCESTDKDRLDPANGLPLAASLDALFDRGLISFADSGKMLISNQLSADERLLFGLQN